MAKQIKVNFNGLSIDTRTIKKNNLFLGNQRTNSMMVINLLIMLLKEVSFAITSSNIKKQQKHN